MKPSVFIGSSVEAKKICGALQLAFQHEARVSAWYQTFPLSTGTLDSLLTKFSSCEFAIFVFSPDDLATIRKADYAVARDNVLFEAGLFIGMHGPLRQNSCRPNRISTMLGDKGWKWQGTDRGLRTER